MILPTGTTHLYFKEGDSRVPNLSDLLSLLKSCDPGPAGYILCPGWSPLAGMVLLLQQQQQFARTRRLSSFQSMRFKDPPLRSNKGILLYSCEV